MGPIQSGINQLLHTAGAYATAYKMKKDKAEKAAEKQATARQSAQIQATGNQHMRQVAQQQISQQDNLAALRASIDAQPTNFGMKVGDLPEAMRAEIYKQSGLEDK